MTADNHHKTSMTGVVVESLSFFWDQWKTRSKAVSTGIAGQALTSIGSCFQFLRLVKHSPFVEAARKNPSSHIGCLICALATLDEESSWEGMLHYERAH